MFTLFINIIILSVCLHGGIVGFCVIIGVLLPFDIIIIYSIVNSKNQIVAHKTEDDDEYHYVDLNGDKKIDWWEM